MQVTRRVNTQSVDNTARSTRTSTTPSTKAATLSSAPAPHTTKADRVALQSQSQAHSTTSSRPLTLRLPGVVTQKALLDLVASMQSAQWFTGKGRDVASVDMVERARVKVPASAAQFEDALLRIHYKDGGSDDTFHIPVKINADGSLSDALEDADFVRAMTRVMKDGKRVGNVVGEAMPGQELSDEGRVKAMGVPQSNVSIKVGDSVIFKAYRKPEAGVSIEREVTAHLTTQQYKNTAQLLGTLTMETKSGPMTIGMAFEQIKAQGDGWTRTLDALQSGDAHLIDQMALLGKRIGEMHKALGAPVDDVAFKPQPITRADLSQWKASIAKELDDTIAKASAKNPALGKKLADAKPKLLAKLDELDRVEPSGMKTRIHGDLHLGQVLSRDNDWVVLDFEGEPARTKEERRGFYAPLRDVAGMLRSFDYAEHTARNEGANVAEGWSKEAGQAFVDAYKAAVKSTGLMPKSEKAFDAILSAVELEKALYEVRYELVSRPAMVDIPASRVLEIANA